MEQLLSTKFYIPTARKTLVSRPLLIERMNEGLRRKLTLVSAPAGFGKTTLVSEWVEQLHGKENKQNAVAWLSLDTNDNDLVRFLTYVIGAIRQADGVESELGKGALGMLQSPQPPPTETILISLINDIAASAITDSIILILDDYHVIDSPIVNNELSFLLEHQPPNLHLLIATREDPQLPLSRLRASGQLNELRAKQLRFNSSESAEFLNQVMGLNLSEEDIRSLEHRTEGWIAGLQLAAVSMQSREDRSNLIKAFSGSHRLVLDYLIEEVLDQQPVSMQNFLLQTAVLDQMTSSLCDAITGQSGSDEILDTLEHANLFIIPLDEERRWYRYHHLFSDLLRTRLQKTQFKEERELHHRASIWYAENGYIDEAIEHAYRVNDFERVADLVDENTEALWRGGEHTKLRRWLEKIPNKLMVLKPNLCILNGWNLFIRGHLDEAENTLDLLPSGVEKSKTKSKEQSSNAEELIIQGRAAAIRAFLASHRGTYQEVLKYGSQALEYLPEEDLSWRSAAAIALGDGLSFTREIEKGYQTRLEAYELTKKAGNIYLILIASMKLAATMRNVGKIKQAIELCDRQLKIAKENGMAEMDVAGWLMAMWGELLAETNNLDEALELAQKGVELTERGTDVAMRGWAYLCMLRILFTRGDMSKLETLLQTIETFSRDNFVPPWIITIIESWKVRILLAQGKLDFAEKWADNRQLRFDQDPLNMQEYEYLVLARIQIARGQYKESIILLEKLLQAAQSQGFVSRVIEILILKALALQESENSALAISDIKNALSLAEQSGFFRIFLDEGTQIAQLLYKTVQQGDTTGYASRVLLGFNAQEKKISPPKDLQTYGEELIEPLSDREIDVLKLIAEGLTNQEIAVRLFISTNTVKVHIRHIFGKLNTNSRLQTVSKAKDMGILPTN